MIPENERDSKAIVPTLSSLWQVHLDEIIYNTEVCKNAPMHPERFCAEYSHRLWSLEMRILLVEGAPSLTSSRLGDDHAVIACAEDADEALSILRHDSFHLILLNLTVNVQDGFDLIRRLRSSKNDTPLLALTGKKVADRVKALDLGADDAVTEPLDYAELRARIIAITHRVRGFGQSLLAVGDLSLCLITREARFRGTHLPLTGKEFSVLQLMVLRKGAVITKTSFLTQLYGEKDEPEIKIIDVFMCKLRKKLEQAGAISLIGTVWGQGYILRDPAIDAASQTGVRLYNVRPMVA